MKKKKSSGGGANWMDTYGDMVTLLLCFFVLLFSMSSLDAEKYMALVMSFNPFAMQDVVSDPGGTGPSADENKGAGVFEVPQEDDKKGPNQQEIDDAIENLFLAIQAYVNQAGVTESVSVSNDGGRVYVSFDGTAFFNADSYALRSDALPILDHMAEMLSEVASSIDEVRIIGHTAQGSPDRINDEEFDRFLSSNRATRVLLYIQTHTNHDVLDPAKLHSEGWGQWHPIAPNDDEAGRKQNRRVEMIISGRNLEEEMGASGGMQSYETTD